ncbi:proline-rich receptor-like protein kinase PERK2 [Gigantopelta aegis]|uniref:proline-rich receptor-like protein kinase PERK2 n=1 Tax=Gigantopelta aegis TaxID=1735272 RepID=UPI001B88C5EE|nr:proline-rich receptor-like protein kinase PERK2 [Gigantopelta aegis]
MCVRAHHQLWNVIGIPGIVHRVTGFRDFSEAKPEEDQRARADQGRSKPTAQLPAATYPVVHPQHRSTPARPADPAQPDPAVDVPGADPDLNQALMESPPTTPQTSTPGIPVLPPPPRKSAAVESQARLAASEKRKAIASPGDQPVKPSPPPQPPTPPTAPTEDLSCGQP